MTINWKNVSKGYVVCPDCDGEGRYEVSSYGRWQDNGRVVECETCGGAGEVEEEEGEEEEEEG